MRWAIDYLETIPSHLIAINVWISIALSKFIRCFYWTINTSKNSTFNFDVHNGTRYTQYLRRVHPVRCSLWTKCFQPGEMIRNPCIYTNSYGNIMKQKSQKKNNNKKRTLNQFVSFHNTSHRLLILQFGSIRFNLIRYDFCPLLPANIACCTMWKFI